MTRESWTKKELEASVVAYVDMLKKESNNDKFTKTSVYENLSQEFGRSPKAYEYRMQNISYIYDLLDKPWLKGLNPLRNVGANVAEDLRDFIYRHDLSIKDIDPRTQSSFDESYGRITKSFPRKGPFKQYRFENLIEFSCQRCKKNKKSKLLIFFNNQQDLKVCNGCYGESLSLYENFDELILDEDNNVHSKIIEEDYSAPDLYVKQKTRGNLQRVFANLVKSNYRNECAVSGISTRPLLIGAHIIPWSEDEERRLDPKNGICFSIMLEKCFDNGFFTIDSEYKFRISPDLSEDEALHDFLAQFEGNKLNLPKDSKFYPSQDCLKHHWNRFGFKK